MCRHRLVFFATVVVGVCGLAGCNALPVNSAGGDASDSFVSQKINSFSSSDTITFQAETASYDGGVVDLADDVLSNAPQEAWLVIDPADVTVVFGKSAGVRARGRDGHEDRRGGACDDDDGDEGHDDHDDDADDDADGHDDDNDGDDDAECHDDHDDDGDDDAEGHDDDDDGESDDDGDGHGRAEIVFYFADSDEDACEVGEPVGPFVLIVEGGTVSMGEHSFPLTGEVRELVRSGHFSICIEVWADFDGSIGVAGVSFEFGEKPEDDEGVEVCHRPPGNPDNAHTITVGAPAVKAHLAHGDYEGACEGDDDNDPPDADGDDVADDLDICADTPAGEDVDADGCSCSQRDGDGDAVNDCDDLCPDTAAGEAVVEDGCSCSQRDGDGDGVNDCDDLCPDTAAGALVGEDGCVPVSLSANAGPDVTVFAGEQVTRVGEGSVLEGEYDPAGLVYEWEQVLGPDTSFESSSPPLSVDTSGLEGEVTFRLTVSTPDGSASVSDEFIITVMPVYVESVSAGRWHNVALKNTTGVDFWGLDRFGQMGDGSLANDVASVDAAANHTLVALTDGTVWTFGRNVLTDSAFAVQVTGVDDVVQVAAQASGGLMLRGDGSVWGFGDDRNALCQLAGEPLDGTGDVLGPIPIPDLPSNMVAISAGAAHGMALDADGNAWVWGSRFGCTPQVMLSGVTAVAAGDTDSCLFLGADGTAWGMGFNLHGQLGNGTGRSDYGAVTPVVGLSDVVSIAAGDRHSLFLLGDGTLWASGWNHDCQLGLETEIDPVTPVYGDAVLAPAQVPLDNVVDMAGGYAHSVAVTSDNTVWVWGLNSVGQLTGGTATTLPYTVCTPMPIEFIDQ